MKGTSTKKNEITGNFRRGGYSSKIKFRKLFMEELRIRYNNGQKYYLDNYYICVQINKKL